MSQPSAPSWIALLLLGLSLASPAAARTRPHYGGALRVEVPGDPLQQPSGLARRLVLDGLTRLDERGDIQPSLAERWSAENDNHRWQFRLRSGVSFQDGRPLTSIAVAASLAESCRIAPCPWSGVHAVGPSLIVTSEIAIPELPALLAEDRFRIQALGGSENSGGDNDAALIGTGPFRLAPAQTKGSVHLEANEDCWQGRPFLDSIELVSRPSGRETGEFWADFNQGSKSADLIALEPGEARQAAQRRLTLATQPAVALLALEIREDALNPQLRAALALAIDRSALYQVIFQKQGEVTASLLPASLSGYSFLFPSDRDLARAQAQRGGLTPPPLTIAADNTASMQLAAARIALNLQDAGFHVRVLPALPDGRVANAQLTLRLLPLASGRADLALDAMLRALGQDAAVPADDPAAAYRAERDFLDRHTLIPLLYLPRTWAVSSRVRDLRLNFDGSPDLANASLEDAP